MDWIPAISTTAAFAAILWLARKLIETRLVRSVQHEFDRKLKVLEADLRAKELQIAALQGGALTAMANRQAVLDKRRLEAVDQLWAALGSFGPAKVASAWMAVIKFEPSLREAARNPRFREMFEVMAGQLKLQPDTASAAKARPYISPLAWALFSSYSAIVSLAYSKLQMLKAGVDTPDVFDKEAIKKLIKAALPGYSDYIDQHGESAYHYLLDPLETNLLEELNRMLQGKEADAASVERAAEIRELVEAVLQKVQQPAEVRQAAAQMGAERPA